MFNLDLVWLHKLGKLYYNDKIEKINAIIKDMPNDLILSIFLK